MLGGPRETKQLERIFDKWVPLTEDDNLTRYPRLWGWLADLTRIGIGRIGRLAGCLNQIKINKKIFINKRFKICITIKFGIITLSDCNLFDHDLYLALVIKYKYLVPLEN